MKQDKEPFFSIIIPTYNRSSLIFDTLNSVFDQKYRNFEVIVVDNASTDDSIELLKPLEDEGKIRLIQNEKNIERARARNRGIANAKGDFLTFLDSDDFMYPNNLQDAAEFVKMNPEYHFFHNYYELVNANKESIQTYDFPSADKHIQKLAIGNFISCIGVFVSKEVYSTYKFNEDEKILGSEDWELWLRVLSNYKLGTIKKINSGALFHAGRSISSYNLESIVERKKYLIDNVLQDKEVKKVFGKYESTMRASALIFTATSANEAGLFKEAKKYLKVALKLKPSLIFNPRFIRVAQIAQFKMQKQFYSE